MKTKNSFQSTAGTQRQMTVDEVLKLAIAHFNSGRYSEAEQLCAAILQALPNHLSTINIKGAIALKTGRYDLAYEQFQKALAIKPDNAPAYSNLGMTLQEQGKLDRAVESYQKAIAIKPDYATAYSNLGITLHKQGKLDAAVASYEKALAINPGYADAYFNLGVILAEQGKLDEAAANYQKNISIKPDNADAYFNLGVAQQEHSKHDAAIASYQKALALKPDNGMYWAGFAGCVEVMSVSHYDEDFFRHLLLMLDQPTVRTNSVSGAVIRALRHHPKFLQAVAISKSKKADAQMDILIQRLAAIPLLLRLMELSAINDPATEQMLTQIRKSLLNRALDDKHKLRHLAFYSALAVHCFINEYVFHESDAEKNQVESLRAEIESLLENGNNVPAKWILILGAYRLLHSFSWSDDLLASEWPVEVENVLERQIREPAMEQGLHSGIPTLTAIDDAVSKAVRDQYEENPYPRWITAGLSGKSHTVKEYFQHIKLDIDFASQKFPDKPDILIAGCGTGQHSIYVASMFADCNVLAFDLSLSSLSYATRKTRELEITNIEYFHGDILQTKNLDQRFDIIKCIGVLHHMEDPMAGWQTLVDLLRPNGFMEIGLYSDIDRRDVVHARALISDKSYTASPDDIRRFRQEIMNASIDSAPDLAKIQRRADFFNLSGCRDLLFHVQEHRFTLPEIETALRELGLEFLGFELRNSRIMKQFKTLHPEHSSETSLPLWHQFEIQNPDIFHGMYQFWVRKV